MLDAAKQLFIEHGYSRTTMDDIADRAGFGVATLYNYFRTKEGIFATMAREDMSELEQAGEDTLQRLAEDPVDAIFALLQVYNRVYEFISFGLMQEFIIQSKGSGPLHEVSAWVLGWQQKQVANALQHCQERGRIAENLDCKLTAEIIIDLLIRHHQRRSAADEKLQEVERLKVKLALILHGW